MNRLVGAAAKRPTGAGITVFTDWLRTHEHGEFYSAVFEESLGESERLMHASSDFAKSAAILLEAGGESVVSPFALGRSLGEAVMRLCSFIDSDAPPARTLLRMAASQLSTFEGNVRTARSFGAHGRAEETKTLERLAKLHRVLGGKRHRTPRSASSSVHRFAQS